MVSLSLSHELLLQGQPAGATATAFLYFGATAATADVMIATIGATAHTPAPTQLHSSSWANKVAAEQSRRSTSETVVPNWAYLGGIVGPRTRSQPLVYLPPVVPTPTSQPTNIQSQVHGVPTIPPPRARPAFPQPPPFDRPTSTDIYLCTDPSPRRRPRPTTYEIYPIRLKLMQTSSESPARYTTSSPRGSQPSNSKARVNPFTPTQGVLHRAPGPNFKFHGFTYPLGINTDYCDHVPERLTTSSRSLTIH